MEHSLNEREERHSLIVLNFFENSPILKKNLESSPDSRQISSDSKPDPSRFEPIPIDPFTQDPTLSDESTDPHPSLLFSGDGRFAASKPQQAQHPSPLPAPPRRSVEAPPPR